MRVGYLSFNFSPTRNLNGLVSGVFARHNRESVGPDPLLRIPSARVSPVAPVATPLDLSALSALALPMCVSTVPRLNRSPSCRSCVV